MIDVNDDVDIMEEDIYEEYLKQLEDDEFIN